MLDSAMDWITQAASNSLFVFCFCNLIIVTIFIASKPSSNFDQHTRISLPVVSDSQTVKAQHLFNKRNTSTRDVEEVSNTANKSDTEEKQGTMADRENNNPGNRAEDDRKDNDELRRKVEEFIANVNREWRAEQFRIAS